MSGEPTLVTLAGSSMNKIVGAIPVVVEQTGREVVLVGGLAVMCRLPIPYRATTDLDTVDRRADDQTPQLQLLMAAGAKLDGPAGVLVQTPRGEVKVDVLEITDTHVAHLPEEPGDRLYVLSHAWAASTASALMLGAQDVPPVTLRVAEPGPLIAMKLQSIMNRPKAKEGTDLLDIVRLTLDRTTGPVSRAQFESADAQLRADALEHVRLWFREYEPQTLHKIRAIPEGREVDIEDVRLVHDLLVSALG